MNKENTRVLGVGETIRPGDLYEIDGELFPVDDTAVGEIISGDELCDIRRVISQDGALDEFAKRIGISEDEAKECMIRLKYHKIWDESVAPPTPEGVKSVIGDFAKGPNAAPEKAKTNDDGKPPLSRLPWKALREVAQVQAYGYQKYGSWDNWRKGMEVSRNISCAMRHLADYMDGIDVDSESGKSHLAHAVCRVLYVLENTIDGKAIDDR